MSRTFDIYFTQEIAIFTNRIKTIFNGIQSKIYNDSLMMLNNTCVYMVLLYCIEAKSLKHLNLKLFSKQLAFQHPINTFEVRVLKDLLKHLNFNISHMCNADKVPTQDPVLPCTVCCNGVLPQQML